MVRNRHLSRAIMDQSFHEIGRLFEYKADWHGARVAVADRFLPGTKRCSSCGTAQDMPLSRRVVRCDCGLEIHRHLNAAINLEQVAACSAETLNTCGEEDAGLPLASEAGHCEAGTQQQRGSGNPGEVCAGL